MNLHINIIRYRHSQYGIDGFLKIDGEHVCDTCEHPDNYLPCGNYDIKLRHHKQLKRKAPFLMPKDKSGNLKPGSCITICNGPFRLHSASIIIGEHILKGVLIHSTVHFNKLIERLTKSQSRGNTLTLSIEEAKPFDDDVGESGTD